MLDNYSDENNNEEFEEEYLNEEYEEEKPQKDNIKNDFWEAPK